MNKVTLHALGVLSLSAVLSSCGGGGLGGIVALPPVALGSLAFTAPNTDQLLQAEFDQLRAAYAPRLAQLPTDQVAKFEQDLKANIKTAQKEFVHDVVLLNEAKAFSAPGNSLANNLGAMTLTGQLVLAQPVAEDTVLNIYVRSDAVHCEGVRDVPVQLPQPIGGVYVYDLDLRPQGLRVCVKNDAKLLSLGKITLNKGQKVVEVSLNGMPMRNMYVNGSGHFGFGIKKGELPAGAVQINNLTLHPRI